MVMSLADRLKGMISVALLNQVVKLIEDGDEKLASHLMAYRLAPQSSSARPLKNWQNWQGKSSLCWGL